MNSVTVHQFLHGYQGGHRLLASSLPLSASADLVALQRSDLSGPILASKYDGYLTGYALAEQGIYILSRTWSAPEAGRSGAVWTHSLAVSFADLAHIKDLRSLTALFRRPQGLEDSRTYERPLNHEELSSKGKADVERSILAYLVRSLYLQTKATVRLALDDNRAIEEALLLVWSQQWPRLRRRFSFCTGMMTASNPAFSNFDVLVGPPGWFHSTEGQLSGEDPSWLRVVVEDLVSNGGPLRSFLVQAGAEVDGNRRVFGPLAHLFLLVPPRSELELRAAVDELEQVGRPDGLLRLKSRLLEQTEDSQLEAAKLSAMVTHDRIFAESGEMLLQRASQLAKNWPDHAIAFVRSVVESDSPKAGAALDAVAHSLDFSRLDAAKLEFPVLLALMGMRPDLITFPTAWPSDTGRQRQLLQVLHNVPTIPPAIETALSLQLLHADPSLATAALDLLGVSMAKAVLDAPNVDAEWARAVARRPDDVRAWLRDATVLGGESLAIVSQCIEADDPLVQGRQDLFARNSTVDGKLNADSLAFLYVASAHFTADNALAVLEKCFDPLHKIAAEGGLPYRAGRLLNRHLPRLPFWREWDMCEKLRRSLIRRFQDHGWSGPALLRVVREPVALRYCLEYLEYAPQGTTLIRKVANAARSGNGTEEQRQILYALNFLRQ
jgi:hypothetical protein